MNEILSTCRPIAVWAVVSFVAGLLAAVSYVNQWFTFMAMVGIISGGYSFQQIRRYEHRGRRLALYGLIGSSAILATAPLWHSWRYRIEAPVGYQRLNFGELTNAGAVAFDKFLGQKVFLKGYAYPQRDLMVRRFALTATENPNQQNAVIVVELNEVAAMGYFQPAIGVAGVLQRNPAVNGDLKQPKYRLVDAAVYPNRTDHDWSQRTHVAAWGDEVPTLR